MPLFAGETKTAGEQSPADETWKKVRLCDLKDPALPEGILCRLEQAEIRTLGDLAARAEDHGQLISETVVGIGAAAQEKIEAAVDAFWKRRAASPTTEQKALAGDPAALGALAEGDKGKPKPRRRRRSALKGGLQE